MLQVERAATVLQEKVYEVMYDKQSEKMQNLLQEFHEVMDNIAKSEMELQKFKQALSLFYQDVSKN